MRVVIDTNVWVSALVFGGSPRKIFERLVSSGLTLVVSEGIFSETRRIISQKFPDFTEELELFISALAPRLIIVSLGTVTIDVARDPKDNVVLETAIVGRAKYIISGDDDLLSLKEYQRILITSPSDFLKTK